MDHTLIGNLVQGIKASRKERVIGIVIFLTLIQAGIVAMISSFNFTIMNYVKEDNKSGVMKWIVITAICWGIKAWVDYIREQIYKTQIVVELTRYFKNQFLTTLLLQSNHDWLNCNKSSEIYTAIDSGTSALMSTLRFITSIINPLFQAIASIWVISTYVGIKTMCSAIVLGCVFFGGSKLLAWEYRKRGEVNQLTNPLSAYNIHLANTFIIGLLNGNGPMITKTILDNSMKKRELHIKIGLQTLQGYTLLELLGIITITITVYFMSITENASMLIAININMNLVLDKMWWLFHSFHNASASASDWATLEPYLKSVVSETIIDKKCLYTYEISKESTYPPSKEYQIIGNSGAGKSTWMLAEVIQLFRIYKVNWLYLDQRMVIPKTSCITIREFMTTFLKNKDLVFNRIDTQILYWAKVLKLESIINKDTLSASFVSPSGGEEKRIIILQKLLPILMEDSVVTVIFADEITAGLDKTTQGIVRNLIEIVKNRYGITVVNIDHHTYTSESLVKIGVTKVEDARPCLFDSMPDTNVKLDGISNWWSFLDISHRYEKIKNIKSKKKILMPPVIKLKAVLADELV